VSDTILDFYQRHQISPVRQDIADLPAHFVRRAGLYRALGLPPIAIKGKSVLEVGPGSGENALYTMSLNPDLYVAVEPNPAGAAALRARFLPGEIAVEETRIEDSAFRADVVLCEGLLGLCGGDPKALLEHVVRNVKPGGVLVITCIDPISDCAEVLRRAMAHRLVDCSAPLADQVAILRPVFAPHLATLKGMTRSVDDWILDNLLNPASIGPTFSIPEALTALKGRFDLLGCSPRFLLDWRWYKDSTQGNQWAIDAYWRQCHNLLDYRKVTPEQTEDQNRDLMDRCLKIRDAVAAFEQGGPDEVPIPNDPGWFGRGQQYLSLVRR
jgi:SAM-dependent methyltransferase